MPNYLSARIQQPRVKKKRTSSRRTRDASRRNWPFLSRKDIILTMSTFQVQLKKKKLCLPFRRPQPLPFLHCVFTNPKQASNVVSPRQGQQNKYGFFKTQKAIRDPWFSILELECGLFFVSHS